ncbi:MAG: HAD family phosphatase [Chloroflexi bacterium]|nr:HAD family phosphatase [Chloroflexota bacterium]OJV86823.1 MAG: beta-phosphoglucomutase [Chloroflexi bacterium 54-19]
MTNYKDYGVIWDVDGTLLDSGELHFDSWVRLAGDLNKPFTRDDFRATFGRRNPEIIRSLFGEHYSEQEVADLGFQKEEYYRAAARSGLSLLPGVRELLANLHTAGFKQAIGSSAPRQNIELLMELTGIESYFEAIVGSEDTQRGKPDPQVFQVAAEKLGLDPDRCLVMEDAVAGVEAATAAGMASIAVTFVGHHLDNDLIIAGAKRVVKSLEDVQVDTIVELLKIND